MMSTAPEIQSDPLIARLLQQSIMLDMDLVRELYDEEDHLGGRAFNSRLVQSGLVSEREIATAYSNHYLLPLFDPPDESFESIDNGVASCLPLEFCRRHRIVPLSDDGSTLDVAIDCPDSLRLADEVRSHCNRQMRPLFAIARIIDALTAHLYGAAAIESEEPVQFEEISVAPAWVPPGAGLAPEAIGQLDDLLQRAIQMRADDIHLEKSLTGSRTRFRIDGSLVELPTSSDANFGRLIESVRQVSGIGASRSNVSGRGEIAWSDSGQDLSIQVRCCPVVGGENVLLNLRRDPATPPTLESLSMSPESLVNLKRAIEKPHGLILVSGPTGSGKAETLYACLREINDLRLNVFTVEESIRWRLPGVNQIVVDPAAGVDYHRGMEICLEQDPDVMLVGQIRDSSTAEMCVRAASGGRVVFSTLAASRPESTLRHLEAFGIAPYAIGETVRALVAQRRLRSLCENCKQPHTVEPETATRLGLQAETTLFQAAGCNRCFGTGYRGLETVFEVARVDSKMAEMIRTGRPAETITAAFKRSGGVPLKSALMKVAVQGRTSLAEVRRVL